MKHLLSFIILPFIILFGCSSFRSAKDDTELKIIPQKVDSWVNLMPGSKPSFFISGSLIIESRKSAFLDSVNLLKCQVIQEDKLLYELQPDFQIGDINMDLVNAAGKLLSFNLQPGSPVKKELNMEKPVSMDFYLSAFTKVFRQRIDSIKVTKAY